MANLPPEEITIAELPQGEIIPYDKPPPPPGRNPMMAELPPLWQISSNTNSICNIGTACAICFGRKGGGEKSHRWRTFTIWHFIRGKDIHGGVPFDTGFALFRQHDVSPTNKSIPYNYNQPYISRNMSTCVVTSQLAHNQRLTTG